MRTQFTVQFLRGREGVPGLPRLPGYVSSFHLRFGDRRHGELLDFLLIVVSLRRSRKVPESMQAGREVSFEVPAAARVADLAGYVDVVLGVGAGFGTAALERACGPIVFPIPRGEGLWDTTDPGIAAAKGFVLLLHEKQSMSGGDQAAG